MVKTRRHKVERKLFGKAYRKLKVVDERLPDEITIGWKKEGKPFVKESIGVGLSCSHDDKLCLCVAGRAEQGCDIETITHRSEEEWRELLEEQGLAIS
jgi:phosphopantetheinyl transferase